jgi:large conductance mechanosensitive channel
MRGNLVELAVAFVMGAAFATVVKSFTDMLLEIIGKAWDAPAFDKWVVLGLTKVGPFLSALLAFLTIAFVVYFFVVKPYEIARQRFMRQEVDAAPPEDVQLLKEIRDLLAGRPTGTM